MHDVEDKVELRHGADQLSFQERRPFLLQGALSPEVTLRKRGSSARQTAEFPLRMKEWAYPHTFVPKCCQTVERIVDKNGLYTPRDTCFWFLAISKPDILAKFVIIIFTVIFP